MIGDANAPYINEVNGVKYWFINGTNTNVKAEGQDGADAPIPSIRNGYWYIGETNTNVVAEGQQGEQGISGKTSYLHIKYSNDGGQSFTSNNGESVGKYMGQYTDFSSASSNSVSSYKWAQIKGDDGVDGASGYTPYISNGYWYLNRTINTE